MEMNPCDMMNQLDSDSHLPPRKRLLAGFKKLNPNNNNNANGSSPSDFASSSSTSNSNGSSSAPTHVQTHLDNLLASRFNNDQSPEELVASTRSAAALAVKAAKAARAIANEKALVSARAIAAAKRALELVDSFPKEAIPDTKERSPKKNKQKKHVPVELLYSKGQLRRDEEDDLARRLHRAIDNTYPRVLRTYSEFEENGQRYKKHKKNKNVVEAGGGSSSIIVTGSMKDIAGIVDSDSSYEGLEIARSNRDEEADSKKAGEESSSLGKRRGRVKLKKIPLSICNSRNQENGTPSASTLPVAQPQEDGVIPAWKCQDLKAAPECVKQNKAVRSS
ncbi:PREDICTED: uncharacterized protein LOC104716581 [Camelina sativa]|uniref:Uncharacterized protein LOC104716581 n=1 Tax=Camelina sativa TaxID=90675 RepID=A0ABM0TVZ7_CAMSA|nr:PREDICTED: uncharacterized protein LOC104716581 [Camelina sativa]